MKQISLTILFFILIISINTAQMVNIDFKEYDLDNGLHVILHKDNSVPIVTVSVMYHVGSKNEKSDRTGFAHFFEHLLFEGTENIKRGEYDKYVESAGGTLNANTTYDRTYYYEILPSNQLELGLWLESERMLHAKVEKIGIETQRKVVKEEKRQRYERPYGTVLSESMKRAFTKHPYNWSVIGSMEHLDAAQEIDYKTFYKDFYVPNNAVLSIAGDIEYEEVIQHVKKYFGSIPKKTSAIYRPDIIEAPLGEEVRDTIYDNIQMPAVVMTYRIPAQGTEDFYAVDMLNTLMSQGESSRLYSALVDNQQKALYVGSFPLKLEDPGANLAFGIANMGVSPQDLELAMNIEFEKAQNELISDKEFQKLKNQIENDFVNNNTSMASIAESLANYHMYYGNATLINTELERYMNVTREDIKAAANKYFNKNNRVVLHYLPKPNNP